MRNEGMQSFRPIENEVFGQASLTRETNLENGMPFSRAKAHSIREAVKRLDTVAKIRVMMTMQIYK